MGSRLPWAWLWVENDNYQEVSFNSANASGHYSLGVPAGTYRVGVYSEDFTDRRLEGVAVNQDTVLNITLDSGVLLEGKVVDEVGQPVSDAQVCAHLSTEPLWENPFCSETNPVGWFSVPSRLGCWVYCNDPTSGSPPANSTAAGSQWGRRDGPRADSESGPHAVRAR